MEEKEKEKREKRRIREKTIKQIAKTRESIRKKHRALKTGTMEEEVSLEKRFKPIVEPLKRIADRVAEREHRDGDDLIKKESEKSFATASAVADDDDDYDEFTPKKKRQKDDDDDDYDEFTPKKKRQKFLDRRAEPRKLFKQQDEPEEEEEEVFETENGDDDYSSEPSSLERSARLFAQSPEGRDLFNKPLGPLGRKYMTAFFRENDKSIDNVYGVYFGEEENLMLGDKRFDVDTDDSLIIGNTRYKGTPGIYELIFKKVPNTSIYSDADKQVYKNILLSTNAYRRDYRASQPIKSNRGHKYMNIIGPLVRRERGTSLPSSAHLGAGATTIGDAVSSAAMRLTDNKIDYVHWDDPNELVDRLQLLDASRRAGNNAHDNEILSILEELREAGFIVN